MLEIPKDEIFAVTVCSRSRRTNVLVSQKKYSSLSSALKDFDSHTGRGCYLDNIINSYAYNYPLIGLMCKMNSKYYIHLELYTKHVDFFKSQYKDFYQLLIDSCLPF